MSRQKGCKNKVPGMNYTPGYYADLHVLIPPEIMADFKIYLAVNGLSQVEVISRYIKFLVDGGEII